MGTGLSPHWSGTSWVWSCSCIPPRAPLHPNDPVPHFLYPQGKSPGCPCQTLVALTVSPVSHRPLVYTVSILLPAAYLIGLFFTLKTHTHIYDIHISDCHSECPHTSWLQGWLLSLLWSVPHVSALSPVPGHHHSAVVHWSRWRALLILLLSTLCMSACADLATEHISPILTNSTISQVSCLCLAPRTEMCPPGMGTCPGCSWNPKSSGERC